MEMGPHRSPAVAPPVPETPRAVSYLNLTTAPPRTSPVAKTVKCLSAMRETWVQSLGREDSLEKETATHSSTLAQKIPWTEEPGAGYCPWGRKESGMTERLPFHFASQPLLYSRSQGEWALCLTAAAWQSPNTSPVWPCPILRYPSGLLLFLNDVKYLYNTSINTSFPYAMSDPLSIEFSRQEYWSG